MLLLHSQSFPHYGLERFFEFARDAGFEGVEIMVSDNYDTQNPEYLKRLQERSGVAIRAFSLAPKKEDSLYEAYQNTVREFPGATMNLQSAPQFSFHYKKWMNNIVPKLSQKYNLKFNRKNAPFGTMLGFVPKRSENSIAALKEAGNVCIDLSALWMSKEDVMRATQFLGNHMKHVYISNVHANKPFAPLTKGILPIESFLTKLARGQFKGDFTLQLSPSQIHEGSHEKRILETLKESKDFFDKYFTHVYDQIVKEINSNPALRQSATGTAPVAPAPAAPQQAATAAVAATPPVPAPAAEASPVNQTPPAAPAPQTLPTQSEAPAEQPAVPVEADDLSQTADPMADSPEVPTEPPLEENTPFVYTDEDTSAPAEPDVLPTEPTPKEASA